MPTRIEGNTAGLKTSQKRALERLYRRKKMAPGVAINHELGVTLCALSGELGRQVGLLIDRRGKIESVIVGDKNEIVIPELSRLRAGAGRLRGLRLVHTHLRGEGLTDDDLNDLAMLRLDLIMAITGAENGEPKNCHLAWIDTDPNPEKPWRCEKPFPFSELSRFDCATLIDGLEADLTRLDARRVLKDELGAILVHVSPLSEGESATHIEELKELARTEKIICLESRIYRGEINPKTVVGQGRLKDLLLLAMSRKADMILFDQELSATQTKIIGGMSDLPLLDRTQLILRIFGNRAHTADGKLRVEQARLRYLLPRIGARDDALSRIRGGIGMRGPGETAMELSRRRIQERLKIIRGKLDRLGAGRAQRRHQRKRSNVPQVAIIGYTNAGKSSLLNALTKSKAEVEDKLFATLDPMSRRVRFPSEREIVFSDTVGFIRALPEHLLDAFRSTLEELSDADLLLHLIDISSPDFQAAMETVESILADLAMSHIPRTRVFNKIDQVEPETARLMAERYDAQLISVKTGEGLRPLTERIIRDVTARRGQRASVLTEAGSDRYNAP